MIPDAPSRVDPVVVAAPRLPPSPGDGAFSIIRLDPQLLKTTPRLDDALQQIPGFSLFRRVSSLGANPTTQGVSLRGIAGSAASRALVTLDGVPQNDPFGGWVIFNSLPTLSLGQVTIVRGAGAGAYGAGALTGVIALDSAPARAGDWIIDGEVGELDQERISAMASIAVGPVIATFFASQEHSNGWIPIREGRGPADASLTLTDETASARFQTDIGRASGALRISVFQEDQGSGLVGAASRERGGSLSVTAAAPPTTTALGWRAQTWLMASDLANSSVAVSAHQLGATLADNEYATPALGLGANAAVRKAWLGGTLELGVDVRNDAGEDREAFGPVNGVLTKNRLAGGDALVSGVYVEATRQTGRLQLTGGGRLDDWQTFDAHDIQGVIGGATNLDLQPPARGGLTPSGRLGARWDLADDTWLRGALYSGFRPPTLNELFRPFRVGNFVTLNNTALVPERLYGAEGGLGGEGRSFSWSATGFYNRLVNPVTNVTLHDGPYLDSVAGFIPAGGALLQRENVGAVDAFGVEADGCLEITANLDARADLSWTHARVNGGAAAPQLTGLRPAETPALAVTAGIDAHLGRYLTLTLDGRYESQRFVDDQNRLNLAPSVTMDARLDWAVSPNLTIYLAAENLFNTAIQQDQTTAGLLSYGPPRVVSVGMTISSQAPSARMAD